MNSPRLPLLPVIGALLLGAAACAGCHNNKAFTTAYIESINAENRQLEDALYQREYELEKLRKEREKRTIPDPDERLPLEDSPPRRSRRSPSGLRTTPDRTEDLGPPKIEFDEATPAIEGPIVPKPNSRPDLAPPDENVPPVRPGASQRPMLDEPPAAPLDLKPIEVPQDDKPPVLQREEDPAPPPPAPTSLPRKTLAPPAKREPAPEAEELPLPKPSVKGVSYEEPAPAKPSVQQIIVNSNRTAGLDLDARPGDDGITLWLEPRDADGKFLADAGSVAVVALDPQQTGPAARIARWDLTSQQLARRLMKVEGVRGYQLQLPWKGKSPEHPALRVAIRYETSDGRRLEATRDLEIELPPEPVQRWLPRSSGPRAARESQAPANESISNAGRKILSSTAPPAPLKPEPSTDPDTQSGPAIAPASSVEPIDEPAPLPPQIEAKPLPKKSEPAESSPGKRLPPPSLSDDIEPRRRPTWKPTREEDDE